LGWVGRRCCRAHRVPVPRHHWRNLHARPGAGPCLTPVKPAVFRRERPDFHRCGLLVPAGARPCHRPVIDRDADVSADVISGSLARAVGRSGLLRFSRSEPCARALRLVTGSEREGDSGVCPCGNPVSSTVGLLRCTRITTRALGSLIWCGLSGHMRLDSNLPRI
jgi:hypothetical protein